MRPDTPVLNIPPVLPSGTAPGGIVKPANGGTGLDGSVVSAGQLLIGKPSIFGFVLANLIAGSNVTIVDGDGSITISATGGGGGGVTPAALTRVNDTNVSLTLSGTPSTALLQAVTLTLGWIGQLSQARGGTGIDTSAATDGQLLIGRTSDHSLQLAALTAGVGITVTNAGAAITIATPNVLQVPLTPPVNANYSWVNQGTATLNAANGMIFINAPALAGNNQRLRDMAAPATPYTLTAGLIPVLPNLNFAAAGVAWRESSSGKTIGFNIVWDTGGASRELNVDKFTNPSTFSAHYTTLATTPSTGILWLRLRDDGTNRICSFSYDGINFQQLHSVGRTDFMTADRIAFYAEANNATFAAGVSLVSWLTGP